MEEIVCKVCHESKTIDHFSEKALNNVQNKDVHLICFECLDEIKKKELKKYNKKQPTGIFKECKQCLEVKDTSEMLSGILCNDCYLENARKRAEEIKSTITEKFCPSCNNTLPIENFANKSDSKDGYAPKCRKCVSEYNLLYKAKNKDKINQKRNEERKLDPNILEKDKARREKYREKTRVWERQHNKKNRQKKSSRDRIYKKKRRDRDPAYRAYQNIKRQISKYIEDYSKLGKQQKSRYYIDENLFEIIGTCPGKDYQLDHIIPLRCFDPNDPDMLKFAHDPNNLRWLIKEDNNKKLDYICWDIIEANARLLEIASILKLTKEDDGNVANKIFPIVDGVFIGR